MQCTSMISNSYYSIEFVTLNANRFVGPVPSELLQLSRLGTSLVF